MKKGVSLIFLLALIFVVFASQPQIASAGIFDSVLGCKNERESCNFAPGNWCCGTLKCDHAATWKCYNW